MSNVYSRRHLLSLALALAVQSQCTADNRSFFTKAGDLCSAVVTYFSYGRYSVPELSQTERAAWIRFFDGGFPEFPSGRVSEDLLWHLYRELPEEVTRVLERLPEEPVLMRKVLDGVAVQFGRDYMPSSTVSLFVRRWQDHRFFQSKVSFAEWRNAGLSKFDERCRANSGLSQQLKVELVSLTEEVRARERWTSAFQIDVPVESLGRNRVKVQIGDQILSGIRRGNSLILQVPAEKVAHPNWNPMSEKVLIEMAGERVSLPTTWPAVLGHDGKFYLLDGNHRFALSGKKVIPVEVRYPLRTVPLIQYLDLFGIQQPDIETIRRLFREELGFSDLVPEWIDRKLILRPE